MQAALAQTRGCLQKGQIEAAERAIQALEADHPDDLRVAILSAELLVRKGDLDAALTIVQARLREQPDTLGLHRLEVRALLDKKDFAAVLQRTRQSLSGFDLDANLMIYRCRALLALSRFEEAEALCRQGAEKYEADGRFLALNARALYELQRFVEAERMARKALEADPSDLSLALLRCRSLFEMGHCLDATEAAEAVLAKRPKDGRFGFLRCRALLEIGHYEAAIEQAEVFLAKEPNDETLLGIKGRALLGLGRPMEFCQENPPPKLTTDVGTTPFWQIYAKALEASGSWQASIDWLEPHFKAGRKIPYVALSTAYLRRGRRDEAEAVYRRAAEAMAAKLPQDLTAALLHSDSYQPKRIPNPTMTGAAVERLWSWADKERWSQSAWLARMRWGQGAQILLRNLLLSHADRLQELLPLVDISGLEVCERELEQGRSVIMTGGHLGAYPMALAALAMRRIPVLLVTKFAMPANYLLPYSQGISATSSPLTTFRGLREATKRPKVVFLLSDTNADLETGDRGYCFSLLDQQVVAPSFPPWLAHRLQLPTFWVQALFHGDRIRLSTAKMAEPTAEEARDAFAARWWRAHLGHMLRLTGGDPSNLYLDAGPLRQALIGIPPYAKSARNLPLAIERPQAPWSDRDALVPGVA